MCMGEVIAAVEILTAGLMSRWLEDFERLLCWMAVVLYVSQSCDARA